MMVTIRQLYNAVNAIIKAKGEYKLIKDGVKTFTKHLKGAENFAMSRASNGLFETSTPTIEIQNIFYTCSNTYAALSISSSSCRGIYPSPLEGLTDCVSNLWVTPDCIPHQPLLHFPFEGTDCLLIPERPHLHF
jgi:hypothetical protein